mgnify:CR=1 FL=1
MVLGGVVAGLAQEGAKAKAHSKGGKDGKDGKGGKGVTLHGSLIFGHCLCVSPDAVDKV